MRCSSRKISLPTAALIALITAPLMSCGFDEDPAPRSNIGGPVVDAEQRVHPLNPPAEAPCTIHVEGSGDIDIEEDYIPNVVACENGNAPMEALKAQAIQARGYIYYKLARGETSVADSQADQVYSCSYASAEERHLEAARATRGEILTWDGEVIAPFYVAGAIPADAQSGAPESACLGSGGSDETDTEHFVTYNLDRSGCDIDMTTLGWIPEDQDCTRNPQNRGCASQNGQSCLASRGWDYRQMFPFYYGDDIELIRIGGSCGGVWEGFSDSDLFCQQAPTSNGWQCLDEATRVDCQGNFADHDEDCPHGCDDGACLPAPGEADLFCENPPDGDGTYCLNDTTEVTCSDQTPEQITACPEICDAGGCTEEQPDTSNSGQNGNQDQNQDANGGQGPDNGGDDGDDSDDEPFSLVTTSPGLEGGCNQVATSPLPLYGLVIALGLWLSQAIRRPTSPGIHD